MQHQDDSAELQPFTVSDDGQTDASALRSRMDRDGYLYFHNMIPADELRGVRAEILQPCAEARWLRAESPISEGVAAPGVRWIEGQPEFMPVYDRIQQGERFHALAHSRGLLAMLAALFGEEPLVHPRNIARILFPDNILHTTPAHQDYIHIQGTPETYTAWIPLGDCPRSMGSLIVLAGSHRAGILPVHRANGAGGVGIDTGSLPYTWVGGDFAAGDVILFHSHTVHKALPNQSPDRLRLSVDFRYQPISHPIEASSLLPHYARRTWDEIYAGWESDRYQYYWQKVPLRYASADPRVREIRSSADGMQAKSSEPPIASEPRIALEETAP